jgi:hypothetical protein
MIINRWGVGNKGIGGRKGEAKDFLSDYAPEVRFLQLDFGHLRGKEGEG